MATSKVRLLDATGGCPIQLLYQVVIGTDTTIMSMSVYTLFICVFIVYLYVYLMWIRTVGMEGER